MGSPSISIGLPVWNGFPWLPSAVESLRAQTHRDFELILSDNASTDETEPYCRAVAAEDPRIRVSRNAVNLGPVANFNRVLDLARGEFLLWAGSDDLWHPGFLETLLSLLRSNPNAVVAFCAFDNIDGEGRSTRTYPDLFDLPSPDPADRLRRFLAQPEQRGKANLICGLIRRAALIRAGGAASWSEREWGGDMLIVFRLLSLGELVLSRELLFHKRLLPAPPPAPAPRSLASRFGSWREELREREAYFDGYRRLIELAEALAPDERAALQAIVRRRRRAIRREAWGRLLRLGSRRVARTLGGEGRAGRDAHREAEPPAHTTSANVLSTRRK